MKLTIEQWLHKAKKDGYEWADMAMENFEEYQFIKKPNLDIVNKDYLYEKLSEAIVNAFLWNNALHKGDNGGNYWRDICDNLQENGK